MNIADLQLQVHPGDGLIAHFGTAVLVLPGDASRSAFADELLSVVESGCASYGQAPGRQLIRKLAGLVTAKDPDDVGSFAVAAAADEGIAVMLCGSVDLQITAESGKEMLSGREVATWVDRLVHSPFDRLVVIPSGSAEQSLDPHIDLRSGTVAGSGVTLSPRVGAIPAPAPAPVAPAPAPVVEAPVAAPPPPVAEVPVAPPMEVQVPEGRPTSFVSIDLTTPPVEEINPLPLATAPTAEAEAEVAAAAAAEAGEGKILGIYCSRGHFDDPRARFCAICGISMVQQTHNLVWGTRPSLGVLVLDDGASFALDHDYVIGREPETSEQVNSGEAYPLLVNDPTLSVSRVHAVILLRDWDVRIEDARSANGTSVMAPGTTEWISLAPGEPMTITAGTHIRLGDRQMVYDSHFKAS